MDSKIIFLDVHVEGMAVFLRDLKWNVKTVTGVYGPTEEGRRDEKIIEFAEKNKNCVVVTQDQQLEKRLENLGIDVICIQMRDLAKIVDETLHKKLD